MKRVFLDGPGKSDGFSDDYAYLISGLLDLYMSTFESEYLQWADSLQKTQLNLFWDQTVGGFFRASADTANLILRLKDDSDSAEPTANSILSCNLLKLGSLLGDRSYDEKAVETCQAFGETLQSHPWAFPAMLSSIAGCLDGMREIIVVGRDGDRLTQKYFQCIFSRPLVNTVVMHVDPDAPDTWLQERNETFQQAYKMEAGGRAYVTICEGYTCGLPIRDIAALEDALKNL